MRPGYPTPGQAGLSPRPPSLLTSSITTARLTGHDSFRSATSERPGRRGAGLAGPGSELLDEYRCRLSDEERRLADLRNSRLWCWLIRPALAPSTTSRTPRCRRCLTNAPPSPLRKTSTSETEEFRCTALEVGKGMVVLTTMMNLPLSKRTDEPERVDSLRWPSYQPRTADSINDSRINDCVVDERE